MSEIHRFSLIYDPAEDRLGWDTEDQDGATTRLWLTQRLTRALLTAILPMVRSSVATDLPAAHQATVQSWEQAAAMADFGKVPAVQTKTESTVGLVRQVNLTPKDDTMIVNFEFGEGETRTLGIGQPQLRQTLTVIYRLHIAAQWPLDLWPDWIKDPSPAPSGETPVRH